MLIKNRIPLKQQLPKIDMENYNNNKIKRKCIVCGKKLKIIEKDLCSCGADVCMIHRNKFDHDCKNGMVQGIGDKIIASKIQKI